MHYTKTPPLGGRLKQRIADFVVEEEFESGQLAHVEAFGAEGVKKTVERNWPENDLHQEQLHGVLEKYQYDVPNAIRTLTRYLGVSRTKIGYAGLKDKRGITAQRISLHQPNMERLKTFEGRFLDFRPLGWSNQKVELGDLVGNHFVITIRNIEKEEKEIKTIIESFAKECQGGLPNFFGEQRFGGAGGSTHEVGKHLILGQIKEAALLYVGKPFGGETEEEWKKRKELLDAGQFLEVSKLIPFRYRFERAMLSHLHRFPNDFVGCFQTLPKNIRFLFVHAYQSHIFNRVLEKRLELGWGLREMEGDHVEGGQVLLPLVGFESALPGGKSGSVVLDVLKEEGIDQSQFKVHSFAEVSASGAWREMVVTPADFKLLKVEADEFNEGKRMAVVSFSLPKGNYATTVLDELLKLAE